MKAFLVCNCCPSWMCSVVLHLFYLLFVAKTLRWEDAIPYCPHRRSHSSSLQSHVRLLSTHCNPGIVPASEFTWAAEPSPRFFRSSEWEYWSLLDFPSSPSEMCCFVCSWAVGNVWSFSLPFFPVLVLLLCSWVTLGTRLNLPESPISLLYGWDDSSNPTGAFI